MWLSKNIMRNQFHLWELLKKSVAYFYKGSKVIFHVLIFSIWIVKLVVIWLAKRICLMMLFFSSFGCVKFGDGSKVNNEGKGSIMVQQ